MIPKMNPSRLRIRTTVKAGAIALLLLFVLGSAHAQQITNSAPPSVQTPSTVGKLPKWSGVNGGKGILGDSLITETPGTISVAGSVNATGGINANGQYSIGGNRVLFSGGSN